MRGQPRRPVKTHCLEPLTPDVAERLSGGWARVKLTHNTEMVHDFHGYVVRLHGNAILRLNPGGSYWLSSAGWRTATTKQRLNALLPYPLRVVQERWEWFLTDGVHKVPFHDGMSTDELVPPYPLPEPTAKDHHA